jgi:hypothetical protein
MTGPPARPSDEYISGEGVVAVFGSFSRKVSSAALKGDVARRGYTWVSVNDEGRSSVGGSIRAMRKCHPDGWVPILSGHKSPKVPLPSGA